VDEFQINGISPINSTFSMPVKAITGYNGTYTISLANFNSFPTGACISLYDTFNGVTTDLKTSNYVFTLNSSTTNARFVLNITLNPLDITTNTSQPSCVTPNIGEITAIGNNAGPWNYYWKDASGTILKTSLNKASADTISNLTGGNYLLEINTVGQCDNRDSVFTIVPVETVSAQFTSLDTTYLSNGASVTFNNNSINAVNSSWDFGDGFGFSSSFNPTYNYSSAGIYTVSLIATSNSGCLDTAYKSVVVIIDVTGISSQNAVGHLIVKTLDENEFLLEGIQTKESNLNFKLYDALGKLITDFGNYNSEEIHLSVNLKEQKAGVYYLNIIGTKDSKTIKLMVK
jgi:PKD repeat protein